MPDIRFVPGTRYGGSNQSGHVGPETIDLKRKSRESEQYRPSSVGSVAQLSAWQTKSIGETEEEDDIQWVPAVRARSTMLSPERLLVCFRKLETRQSLAFRNQLAKKFADAFLKHLKNNGRNNGHIRLIATGTIPSRKRVGTFFKIVIVGEDTQYCVPHLFVTTYIDVSGR